MDFRSQLEKYLPSELRWEVLKSWLRSLVFEDWGTKLIALAITLAFWLGVTGLKANTTERFGHVKLAFVMPSDMEIVNEPIQEVEITLSGDKRQIERVRQSDNLTISLDMGGYKTGNLVVQLKPETVSMDLPTGVKLEQIEPSKVALRIEKRIEKEVPVKAELSGGLPDGFEIYETQINPAKVRVRGPESYVKALDNLPTEKINIDNRTENLTERQVGINPSNAKITVLDSIVDVIVKIGEKRVEKTFYGVKKENASKTFTVTLFGGKSLLEKLRAEDLKVQEENQPDGSVKQKVILPNDLAGKIETNTIK